MRCGSALVSVGDRAFEVQQSAAIRITATTSAIPWAATIGGNSRSRWVYGPRNGVTYILTFEANKLKRIEFKR